MIAALFIAWLNGIHSYEQALLLGLFLGAINGYLLVGTLWHHLHATGYPIAGILPPQADSVKAMLDYMPPELVGPPYIYFAVGLAFVFVMVVFI